jgi:phosphopantetheine--protein transferase-like protein
MIIGIGTDLIEISRIKNTRRNKTVERIFSEEERRQASDKDSMLAGDFACKECIVKCFGTGFSEGIRPSEIEILRDEKGKPANIDTLSRWCKRTYGMTFQEYIKKVGCMGMKIRIRRNQLKLSEKSAAMAIFLGKNYLGQTDVAVEDNNETLQRLDEVLDQIDGVV